MATRSFIIRQSNTAEHRYTGIYCHWDGYPEYVGVMLRDHYSNDDEVQVLLNRGDISSLLTPDGRDLEGEGSQWREYGEKARTFHWLSEALGCADGMGCEHAYLWNASARTWEHYDLRRIPQSLDHVESLVDIQRRAAAVGMA